MKGSGLFPPWSDTALRLGLLCAAGSAVAVPAAFMIYVRTPYGQDRSIPIDQPVQFDHRHHVRDDGIACLYCHRDAERSSSAGLPATELCMGCHSQILNDSPLLAPVRASYYQDEPIRWNRVHALPEFVFFDHSVHVRAGVDCARCHGEVADMPVVYKAKSLTMGFCLDCHREPEAALPNYVDSVAPERSGSRPRESAPIVTNQLATCTACHR